MLNTLGPFYQMDCGLIQASHCAAHINCRAVPGFVCGVTGLVLCQDAIDVATATCQLAETHSKRRCQLHSTYEGYCPAFPMGWGTALQALLPVAGDKVYIEKEASLDLSVLRLLAVCHCGQTATWICIYGGHGVCQLHVKPWKGTSVNQTSLRCGQHATCHYPLVPVVLRGAIPTRGLLRTVTCIEKRQTKTLINDWKFIFDYVPRIHGCHTTHDVVLQVDGRLYRDDPHPTRAFIVVTPHGLRSTLVDAQHIEVSIHSQTRYTALPTIDRSRVLRIRKNVSPCTVFWDQASLDSLSPPETMQVASILLNNRTFFAFGLDGSDIVCLCCERRYAPMAFVASLCGYNVSVALLNTATIYSFNGTSTIKPLF